MRRHTIDKINTTFACPCRIVEYLCIRIFVRCMIVVGSDFMSPLSCLAACVIREIARGTAKVRWRRSAAYLTSARATGRKTTSVNVFVAVPCIGCGLLLGV